jgi:hypothetical protein
MLKTADIAVYSRDHQLELLVEVKGKADATPEWAAEMRKNLIAYSVIPPTEFFLLAAPHHFYLWRGENDYVRLKDRGENGDGRPPDYVVDALPIITPYLDKARIKPGAITEGGLQLIITSWLSFIVNSHLTFEKADPSEKWLFESGLYEAIRSGSVESEAPA